MSDIIQADIVVVDADTLIYQAAAVNEERTISVTHEPTGIVKSFNTRTEFKKTMKEKQKEITADYLIYDVQTPKDLSCTIHSIDLSINKLEAKFPFADFIYCAGDENNFRLDLPLPRRYKSGRDTTLRPKLLKAAHLYFDKKYKPQKASGYEVDDLSAILAYDYLHKGKNVLLAVPDKDANQFVGLKLFDYTQPDKNIVEVKHWHPVELDSKRNFKSYGVPWLCYQWINGDLSDGFSAKGLAGVKIGDVGMYNMFKDCKKPEHSLQIVVDWFQRNFGDSFEYFDWNGSLNKVNWKDIMQLYYRCAKMKEYNEDTLDCFKLLDKWGIKL